VLSKFLPLAFLLPVLSLSAAVLDGADHPEIPLWPNGAPGFESKKGEKELKKMQTGGEYTYANIHNPSLTVYLPPKDKATGAAVVIAPGGGHSSIWIVHEGYNMAEWLSQRGVAAFVLKYRLAREKGSPYKIEEHALQDGLRAVRLVRSKATDWNVNPDRVGFMGFSAGGELAALVSSRYDTGKQDAEDPVDRLNSRPDFTALVYPGPLGIKSATLTKDVPPAFIAIGEQDNQAITMANHVVALKKAGVSAELHIYANTGHGFGVRERNSKLSVASWPARFYDWLGDRGLLKRS
jgi:acetyl esterase/lipase